MGVPAPLINGNRYSWSSIECTGLVGATSVQLFQDITGISYSDKLNISFVQGASRSPIGWTAGVYEPGDATLQIGKSSFQSMIQRVGPGWMGISALFNISYAEPGEIVTIDTLFARIAGPEEDHEFGPDPLKVALSLKVIQILRNGITPLVNRPF